MLLPELVGPRALAFPTQGPTFPKKPQRPPGICTERFQPRPASGSIPARRFCAGPGWGRRQSVLRPQGEWREGQEGRADPFPSRGPSSPALPASRHGARVGLAALGLTGVRGRSEAWTGDTGLHERRGPGARRAGKARRTAGGRWPGGGAELGLGPADCALLRGGLRGDSMLAAPPASWRLPRPPDRDLVKGLALFSFAPLLLRRPPFIPQLRRCCFSALVGPSPGHWRSR